MAKYVCPRCGESVETSGIVTVCPSCHADLRGVVAEEQRRSCCATTR